MSSIDVFQSEAPAASDRAEEHSTLQLLRDALAALSVSTAAAATPFARASKREFSMLFSRSRMDKLHFVCGKDFKQGAGIRVAYSSVTMGPAFDEDLLKNELAIFCRSALERLYATPRPSGGVLEVTVIDGIMTDIAEYRLRESDGSWSKSSSIYTFSWKLRFVVHE